jgi:hypothetical protein
MNDEFGARPFGTERATEKTRSAPSQRNQPMRKREILRNTLARVGDAAAAVLCWVAFRPRLFAIGVPLANVPRRAPSTLRSWDDVCRRTEQRRRDLAKHHGN